MTQQRARAADGRTNPHALPIATAAAPTRRRLSLYVSWRTVYEAVETFMRAAGGQPSAHGHWTLDLACPCGQPVTRGLAVRYDRLRHVAAHELLPAETTCPHCQARLSERTLLYAGVLPVANLPHDG
jgi:hypothetical protein